MRGVLVRIGVDHAFGGWNAPVDPATGRFMFVPIPEKATQFLPGCERRYEEAVRPLSEFLASCGCGDGAGHFPIAAMRARPMHLDPDFEHLTYGDDGSHRGSDIKCLSGGDLLVFYAGLRSVDSTTERLTYSMVGLFVVDHVVPALEVEANRRHENAHTRKSALGPDDIVVRARPGVSGRCERGIPIGEFRDRAYRVRPDVLSAWGGLQVKNGYIQRSGRPPLLTDAERFYEWWQRQGVGLARNNFGT